MVAPHFILYVTFFAFIFLGRSVIIKKYAWLFLILAIPLAVTLIFFGDVRFRVQGRKRQVVLGDTFGGIGTNLVTVVVTNTGTLDFNSTNSTLGGLACIVSGAGFNGLGALVNHLTNAQANANTVSFGPSSITLAMSIGAKKLGAEINTHTRVTGISRKPNNEWVVHTDKGDITCEYVVNAAGLWAPEVARMAA